MMPHLNGMMSKMKTAHEMTVMVMMIMTDQLMLMMKMTTMRRSVMIQMATLVMTAHRMMMT